MSAHQMAETAPQRHDPVPGVPVVVTGLMGAGTTTVASAPTRRAEQ